MPMEFLPGNAEAFELSENWKYYFDTRHEGLGTTYERFVLHTHFRRIRKTYGIETVLETPIFGMTGVSGINSVWWGRQGAQVTLMDHNRERLAYIERLWNDLSLEARFFYDPGTYVSLPFADQEFEMSWNFAALDARIKADVFLEELARVTEKIIFLCLHNPFNLFGLIRKGIQKGMGPHHVGSLSEVAIENAMAKTGWQLGDTGFFDVPPWPDIAMTKEDFLRKIGLQSIARRLDQNIKPENRISILDYYGGKNRRLKKRMMRYAFLENGPLPFQRFWAHHRYVVFTPRYPL